MTLAELRKKYIGKTVIKECLPSSLVLRSYGGKQYLSFWSGDEWVYSASITVDDDMRITGISCLTCKELVGEDAANTTYKPSRVSQNDYYMLDDELEEGTGK